MTSLEWRGNSVPATVRRGPRSPSWMLDQLPLAMLDGDFFVRFVSIFQELGGTLFDDADNIDNLLDLTVAPADMVRYLGSWIGASSVDPSLADELQRRVVESSAQTLTWRGTAYGLQRFLEVTSGGPAQLRDGGGVWLDGDAPDDTAWVAMSVASTGWMPEDDFIALVRDEVPAHVRAELWVGGRCVWRSADDDAPRPALEGDRAGSTGVGVTDGSASDRQGGWGA